MKAKDIMTSPAITVTPETSVRAAAALLAARAISAVPVLAGGRLVGILSEADLLHRHEIGTDCALHGEPWWLRILRDHPASEDYVRTHAVRVKDIMTREVATVGPDAPLWKIAALFDARRIKRAPVVEAGRVSGIVSRSDLVKALAAAAPPCALEGDEAIRGSLLAELERQSWWRGDQSSVAVENGVVTFDGFVQSDGEETAARVAAESIPGVRGVDDRRFDWRSFPAMY
jgi:CBS domain-containing protein